MSNFPPKPPGSSGKSAGPKKTSSSGQRIKNAVLDPNDLPVADRAVGVFSGTLGIFFKILFTMLIIFVITGAICLGVFAGYVNKYLAPDTDMKLDSLQLNYTSTVCYIDSEGNEVELERLFGEQNRVWADFADIPRAMKDAFIAIEDERFETHHGVDWRRTVGAFVEIALGKDFYGGSTITQQLIKNLTGEKEVTIQRKVQEILRALKLEKNYSKDQILEMYLNTINMSQGCYGVRAAAQTYFGKDISELSIAECASLAGITNRPTYFDPFINPENNEKRYRDILWKMHELGMITDKEYEAAKEEKLDFKKAQKIEQADSKQSYFVDQVISDVIRDLRENFGYSSQVASRMVYSGGLKIIATIDLEVQAVLDEVYNDDSNFPKLKGVIQPESAMTVMTAQGDVVGMVGGRGEKVINRGLNRATQSKRQPGSSIKPVTAYAPAMEYGLMTPYSIVDDAPVMERNGKAYPKNYYSGFRGLMTVKEAIRNSSNAPAMRALQLAGVDRAWAFGKANLGLDLKDRDKDLAPLSLGGLTYGLSSLELTAAYVPFANQGVYVKPRTYTKVYDANGDILYDNKKVVEIVMSEKTVYYMNDCLTNVMKNGTGTPARLKNMPCAGKTGTTDDDNDRWFVGYTPYYVSAVWFGFDIPKELSELSVNPGSIVWKTVMERLHEGKDVIDFTQPTDFVQAQYCMDSGMRPSENCKLDPRGSRVATGNFAPEDVPNGTCTMHVAVTVCAESGMLANEYCPEGSLVRSAVFNYLRPYDPPSVSIDDRAFHTAINATVIDPETGEEIPVGMTICDLHNAETILPPNDFFEDWFNGLFPDQQGEDPNNPYDPFEDNNDSGGDWPPGWRP